MTDTRRSKFLESAQTQYSPPPRWLRWLERRSASTPFSAQTASRFEPNDEGSGSFGRWTLDQYGLPAYDYEMDQYADPRAAYPNTEEVDRRDHWHQVGNMRITALTSNDGTVQVYTGDRGGTFLNRFEAWEFDRPSNIGCALILASILRVIGRAVSRILLSINRPTMVPAQTAAHQPPPPPRGMTSPEMVRPQTASQPPVDELAIPYAHAGGFSYVDDGSEVWASAFRYRPNSAHTERRFGMGYARYHTDYRSIQLTRHVYAPYGDDPLLLVDVEIENTGQTPVSLRHYEYWDVNVYQLKVEWQRSGNYGTLSDRDRRDINRYFEPTVSYLPQSAALRFEQQLKQPHPHGYKPPEQPSETDWDPANIFLADLSGTPDGFYVRKEAFFGNGGARQPDAVAQRKPGETLPPPTPDHPMPYCLVLRRDLTLQPGERKTLRYAYGVVRPGVMLSFLDNFRIPRDVLRETMTSWQQNLTYFTTGEDPVLQREMAWHAYNLLSSTVYSVFHAAHLIPQGSAYLYLHGADGAPRDQALFALPMTYLHPPLAKDMLRLIMRITDGQTGQITYSFVGHGSVSDGSGVHSNPSDLDIFFLLAMSEYLSATADFAFLQESVPFYPPSQPTAFSGTTVLDHIRVAVNHLLTSIGTGTSGLLKVGTGDWSDSIVLETSISDGIFKDADYFQSRLHGESVPNTQMALYVLPLIAALLQTIAPDIVDTIYDIPIQPDRLQRLKAAVAGQWNANGWYNRAVLRNAQNQPVVINRLDLEAQVWALISAIAGDQQAALITTIDQRLDNPSPIGGSLTEGGAVWPAISQLLTWGYARCDAHDLAWRTLNRNTFAMHSTIYPDIWFNTWSGPDGINGLAAEHPGGTWFSPLTPMTDFPAMNANQHGMALLGLIRVCGIDPAPQGDGLRIRPHVPRERFSLETWLLSLDIEPGRIAGRYHAIVDGQRKLYVRVPANATNITAMIDDEPITVTLDSERQVILPLAFTNDQTVRFEVRFTESG